MAENIEIQQQFKGFINTPFLWVDPTPFGLEQYSIVYNTRDYPNVSSNIPIRLGKRIERFLSHQLHFQKGISHILENIQIQKNRITLGELDFLFHDGEIQIHLEVVYKFYLYDPNSSHVEIDKWIGPNKKDSLTQKLNKLKTKQLPRLYIDESKELLQKHNFNIKKLKQYVDFRAQLFVPYTSRSSSFQLINNDCIKGFYLTTKQLTSFKNCRFYIPSKLNWLSEPTENNSFISYTEFLNEIKEPLAEKRSPLCWLLNQDGDLMKFFVVWW